MGRRRRKKMKRGKKFVIISLIAIIISGVFVFRAIDQTIIPAVITLASQRAITYVNEIINTELIDTINTFELTSEDFYAMTTDEAGRLMGLSVDTILVNQVAAMLAVDISRRLTENEGLHIGVPIGLFTGIPIFAGLGPDFYVTILPSGDAVVDYATSFTSAGINQINFQVWLYIEVNMRIVIPLQEAPIPISRQLPLVNTVFAGEVPEGMLLTDLFN